MMTSPENVLLVGGLIHQHRCGSSVETHQLISVTRTLLNPVMSHNIMITIFCLVLNVILVSGNVSGFSIFSVYRFSSFTFISRHSSLHSLPLNCCGFCSCVSHRFLSQWPSPPESNYFQETGAGGQHCMFTQYWQLWSNPLVQANQRWPATVPGTHAGKQRTARG